MYWLMEGLCAHWPSKSWTRKVKAKTVTVGLATVSFGFSWQASASIERRVAKAERRRKMLDILAGVPRPKTEIPVLGMHHFQQ
jgi:hypothetical protein